MKSRVSPLKRLRLARDLSVMHLSVYSGCSMATIRKVDRIDPVEIGNVKVKSLMKLAACLECSPVDLLPFLGATVSTHQSVKYSRDGPRKGSVRARHMRLSGSAHLQEEPDQ